MKRKSPLWQSLDATMQAMQGSELGMEAETALLNLSLCPELERWASVLHGAAESLRRTRVKWVDEESVVPVDESSTDAADIDSSIFFSCLSMSAGALDRICGAQEAKQAVMETLIYPRLYPHFFHSGMQPWKRVLLFGPPGTGKSALVRAVVAKAFHDDPTALFAEMSSSDFLSSYFGASEARIREIFTQACLHKGPVVLYLDEIDSVARVKHAGEDDTTRRTKNEFLRGLEAIEEAPNVFCMASTNVPWELDPAIVRRFERRICLDLPDLNTRKELLEQSVQPALSSSKKSSRGIQQESESSISPKCSLDLTEAAELSEGYSGADLGAVGRMAAMAGVRELLLAAPNMSENEKRDARPRDVTTDDVLMALTQVGRSVAPHEAEKHRQWSAQFGEQSRIE